MSGKTYDTLNPKMTENGTKATVVSGVNGSDIYALMRELFRGEEK